MINSDKSKIRGRTETCNCEKCRDLFTVEFNENQEPINNDVTQINGLLYHECGGRLKIIRLR